MSVVTAACPTCKQTVSVEETQAGFPMDCPGCKTTFIPAEAIAAANKRFEMQMYIGMLVVGVALVAYMAITNRMKPKPDVPPAAAPTATDPAPPAADAAPAAK